MKKFFLPLVSVFGLSFLFAGKAQAVCPVCAIAVGVGVGFSRWLGVDDAITGLWIGGLIVAMIIWTLDWMDRRHYSFKWEGIVVTLSYYLLTVVPLIFTGLLANSQNVIIFGLDKLMLGIIVGSLGFWAGAEWYPVIKKQNGGHAHFPFEKVAMPIAPLVIMSVLFYFLTK